MVFISFADARPAKLIKKIGGVFPFVFPFALKNLKILSMGVGGV